MIEDMKQRVLQADEDERAAIIKYLEEALDNINAREEEGLATVKRQGAACAGALSVAAMAILVLGEAVALSVLASKEVSDLKYGFVGVSIAIGGWLLIHPLVRVQLKGLAPYWAVLDKRPTVISMGLSAIVVGAACLIVWPF